MNTVELPSEKFDNCIQMEKMKKIFPIFFLIFVFVATACRKSSAPRFTPEPAPARVAAPTTALDLSPVENQIAEAEGVVEQTISAPSGMQVVYIREGNLWSWTEAGGKIQVTGTGDLSTVHLSDDGQMVAIMRGREVWIIRVNGMDARLLVTEQAEGGTLQFAPNETLLAVSTSDHIDVVDFNVGSSLTVVTYPALPESYYPKVIWSPDAIGFKTVIPPQSESGQAELLFVFPDGTVGSLAKFALVPLSESLPFLSPDGGYIIYVAKVDNGQESLYLMDSSGATRPYGEAAVNVHAICWLPDSKRFIYTSSDPARTLLGDVAGTPSEITLEEYQMVRWIDAEHFLALQDGNLYLADSASGKMLIDTSVTDFDS